MFFFIRKLIKSVLKGVGVFEMVAKAQQIGIWVCGAICKVTTAAICFCCNPIATAAVGIGVLLVAGSVF